MIGNSSSSSDTVEAALLNKAESFLKHQGKCLQISSQGVGKQMAALALAVAVQWPD
jgi:hypothetical protein